MGLKDRLEEDRGVEERADRGSVTHWRRRLLEEINLEDLTQLTLAQRRVRLERVVGHLLSREGPVLSDRERSVLIRRVVDEALGLGVLEPLLAAGTDPWRVWAWLTQPAALLGGAVPERAVTDPQEAELVRRAALSLARRST